MSASTIAQPKPKSTQAKSPPKPATRFIPKPPTVSATYAPSDIDGDSTFSFTVTFERDAAGRPTHAAFNFGGNATQRVPLPEGALLGKTVVAALATALDIDIAKLLTMFGFTYGFLPLSGETDLTCDTKADGTVKPVKSRTIRATPLPKCRACGFCVVDKPITSAHGVCGKTVAAHDKCCAAPFPFTVDESTFTCTPIVVEGRPRLGVTEDTSLMRIVGFNYVPISDASALLDLSFDGTEPDDASSVCSARTAQDENDDAPIVKAAPKKRARPAAAPCSPSASSCAAPISKKRKIDDALDELAAIFAAPVGPSCQMQIAALFGKYVRD